MEHVGSQADPERKGNSYTIGNVLVIEGDAETNFALEEIGRRYVQSLMKEWEALNARVRASERELRARVK